MTIARHTEDYVLGCGQLFLLVNQPAPVDPPSIREYDCFIMNHTRTTTQEAVFRPPRMI